MVLASCVIALFLAGLGYALLIVATIGVIDPGVDPVRAVAIAIVGIIDIAAAYVFAKFCD